MNSPNNSNEVSLAAEVSINSHNENKEFQEIQMKFLRDVLKSLHDSKYGELFRIPVDPERDNVPDYFEIISNPIDLGTMIKKSDNNEYQGPDEMIADIKLMFSNCCTYNPEGSVARFQGKELEKFFNKKMSKYPNEPPPNLLPLKRRTASSPKKTEEIKHETSRNAPKTRKAAMSEKTILQNSSTTTRESLRFQKRTYKDIHEFDRSSLASAMSFCESALNELFQKRHHEYSSSFLDPVDPVALGIPDYFDVVKCPMDLNTIRTKLKGGNYSHPQQFIRDVRLVFTNCFRYNSDTTDVYSHALKLERVFEHFIATCPSDLYLDFFVTEDVTDDFVQLSTVGRTTRRTQMVENRQIIECLHALEKKIQQISDDVTKIKNERVNKTTGISENGQTLNRKINQRPLVNHIKGSRIIPKNIELPKIEDADPMTYDEKLNLSSKIMCLSEVLSIINQREPWYRRSISNSNKSTIEIDLESLQQGTLRAIEKYVITATRKKVESNRKKNSSNDDLTTREQKLRQRLEDMDSQLTGKTPIPIGGRLSSVSENKPLNASYMSRLSDSSSDEEEGDLSSKPSPLSKNPSVQSNMSNRNNNNLKSALFVATNLLNRISSVSTNRTLTTIPKTVTHISPPPSKIHKSNNSPSECSQIQKSLLGKLGVLSTGNGPNDSKTIISEYDKSSNHINDKNAHNP